MDLHVNDIRPSLDFLLDFSRMCWAIEEATVRYRQSLFFSPRYNPCSKRGTEHEPEERSVHDGVIQQKVGRAGGGVLISMPALC